MYLEKYINYADKGNFITKIVRQDNLPLYRIPYRILYFFVSICIILYFYKIIAHNQTIKTSTHIPIFDRLLYRKMVQFSYIRR